MIDPATQVNDTVIDVPRDLPEESVRSFVNDGYLVMPGLVGPDEFEEIKGDTLKIARGGYPSKAITPVPEGLSDSDVLKSILCIHQPHYVSPVMLKFLKHPKICGVLSQIAAAHLPFWDGSVKCMQSMLFVKPPGFQGQAWHQDEIYIPTRDRSLVGAWIAVDDATVANGCLWVVPGSHRSGYLFPQREHGKPDEFDVSGESYGFDESKEVPVIVKAGTVVFFNGYLLHRSRKNRSDIFRRVLVNHYMNAWSHLPWGTLKEEPVSVAQADRRIIIPVAGRDPYAWKGTQPGGNDVHLRKCAANSSPAKS